MRTDATTSFEWGIPIRQLILGRVLRAAALIFLVAGFQGATGCLRTAQAQTVQAVLFFSPTCQHCHQVITQYLPLLFQNNGGPPGVITGESIPQAERSLFLFRNSRLEILLVDASKTLGSELYMASTRNQQIPRERSGVPRLVIGDEYLVGSLEIPERTGDLVRQGLEQGGLEWPAVDGLADALTSIPGLGPVVAAQPRDSAPVVADEPEDSAATQPDQASAADTAPTAAPATALTDSVLPSRVDTAYEPSIEVAPPVDVAEVEPDAAEETLIDSATHVVAEPVDSATPVPSAFDVVPTRELSILENFQLDPVGNSFSVAVLVLMIASVTVVLLKPDAMPATWGLGILVPVLALVGAGVASYLTYIEATGATAVCGPVGDCNTVNQSEYARLFGMLPVGALGLLGYVAIALAWIGSRYTPEPMSLWSRVSLLVMTLGGTIFSIYLTFLEPFVIGATCAWCLTSSIIIMAIMWLVSGVGWDALGRIRATE